MIHRSSRQQLALALRRYVACRISNDDLADVEVDWRDRGAVAVQGMAWRLYDDMSKHYATGRHAFSREGRCCIARWILFLRSDLEYMWPEYSFIQTGSRWDWLTFGRFKRLREKHWREFIEAGDFEVWPFLRKAELARAVSKPYLLAGSDG